MTKLKVLNLTGCTNLLATLEFSHYHCLELLILENCTQLAELHPFIIYLTCLVSLNLKSCSRLNMFMGRLDELVILEELMIDGTFIREISSLIDDMKTFKIFYETFD